MVSLGVGCYKLTILDAYGDGMCCDYGQGRLEMFDADGYKVLESDGNFGSEEVLEFCIESGQARLKNKYRDQKKLSHSKKK